MKSQKVTALPPLPVMSTPPRLMTSLPLLLADSPLVSRSFEAPELESLLFTYSIVKIRLAKYFVEMLMLIAEINVF